MRRLISSLILGTLCCVPAFAQMGVSTIYPPVQTINGMAPDAAGNVANIATSSMLTTVTIAGDVIQEIAPATGATVVPSAGVTVLGLTNSSLLAALTVTMPASPANGQRFVVTSRAGVTLLSFTGGTINGAPTALSISGYARFIYFANSGYWARTG